jgi:hypothetical protein
MVQRKLIFIVIKMITNKSTVLIGLVWLQHFNIKLCFAVSGVTYTRWGRTTCSHGAQIVYKGYMAGTHYTLVGGGSTYLCIHENPKLGSTWVPGMQHYSSRLHGVEYELSEGYSNNGPFSYRNNGNRDLHDQEAVCVVCYLPENFDILMIPGRPDCSTNSFGWNLEYWGYLMSDNHKRTEYICVDEAPEARLGGHGNQNGALLFPVQEECGSLPCPPFINGAEVACAVCSR